MVAMLVSTCTRVRVRVSCTDQARVSCKQTRYSQILIPYFQEFHANSQIRIVQQISSMVVSTMQTNRGVSCLRFEAGCSRRHTHTSGRSWCGWLQTTDMSVSASVTVIQHYCWYVMVVAHVTLALVIGHNRTLLNS